MKRSARLGLTILGASGAVLLALSACTLGLTNRLLTSSDATEGTSTGTITIAVQTISRVMLDHIEHLKTTEGLDSRTVVSVGDELPSRMYLGAGRVDFSVKDAASGALVGTPWSVYPPQYNVGQTAYVLGSRTLYPGNYVLYADVYSGPSDTFPTVGGSKPFTVIEGQEGASPGSQVIVACYPSNATSLPNAGVDSASYQLPSTWKWTMTGVEIGAEQWFELPATPTLTNITVTPTAGSAARLSAFLYDPYSNHVSDVQSGQPGGTASLRFVPTDAQGSYYLGVVDFGDDTAQDRSFTVSFNASVFVGATSLDTSIGTWVEDSLFAGEYRLYSFSMVADHTYAINWDNVQHGSGDYDKEMTVSGYRQDGTAEFYGVGWGYKGDSYYDHETFYNDVVDDTKTITASADETFYLFVQEGWYDAPGSTYAIKVADVTAQ